MPESPYERRLNEATQLIGQELYRQAVETAGGGIDLLMQNLYEELKAKLGKYDAAALQAALNSFAPKAGAQKGKLTFGGWIKLYESENLFARLEGSFGYRFRYFNPGTLKAILEARNLSAHEDYQPTRAESELVRNNLAIFLQETQRAPKEVEAVLPAPKPERAKGKLPAWTSVATPNQDIRERRFDLGIFAIHLGEIASESGSGQPEYADPSTFFDLTYVTRGLRAQLISMMQRLSGRGQGASVVQLDTTFGGGKTHTLLAMYHLAKHGHALRERDDVRALTNEARVEAPPQAAVAVLDGSYLSPSQPRKTAEGIALKTLWGELAYQLGGAEAYEYLRASDESMSAPGSSDLTRMLRAVGKPILILIDELLDYATKAAAVKAGRGFLVEQAQSFIKALTQAVDPHPTALMVLTLTSSPQQIFGDAARRLQQDIAGQYATFKAILERVQRTEVTAESAEIYEILRRRLFERMGDAMEHETVAAAYWNYYRQNQNVFPGEVIAPDYRQRLAQAYPFHPDLIDVLRDRWGTIQGFQKTRGVLRLLALVVSNLYRKNHGAPLIHVGHIDLADPEIRRELLGHVDSPAGYDSAIGSDIAGLPGSKAETLDQRIGGDYYRFGLCEGLASTLFMYSHSGASGFVGGSKPQLWLGVLQPDVMPALASDAFSKLEGELWYMEKEGMVFRLGVDPNLNMMLVQRMDALRQDTDRLAEVVYNTLDSIAGTKFGKAIIWPEDSRLVRDNSHLKLVIAPPSARFREDDSEMRAQLYVDDILKNAADKHRQFRNTVVFSLPTPEGIANIEQSAIKLMALEEIKNSTGHNLKDYLRDELDQQLAAARVGLPSALWGAYIVTATAGRNDDPWMTWETGIKPYRQGDTLGDRIWNRLVDSERLSEKFDPDYLIRNGDARFAFLWPSDQAAVRTQDLWAAFARYDYLPMLASQKVLQDTIAWGVQRGLFGYATGSPQKPDKIYFNEPMSAEQCSISEFSWLVDTEHAQPLRYPSLQQTQAIPDPDGSARGEEGVSGAGENIENHSSLHGATHYNALNVEIHLNPLDWRQFYNSVIQPLVAKGSNVAITVKLTATHDKGFDLDFIELSIKESLLQISRTAQVSVTTEQD